MKNNQLDKIIKEKLERIRPPLPPDSWEQFEHRLNQTESGIPERRDKAVDETLFGKLHQLEVPYQPANWHTLEERLDREFVRPEIIVRYKTLELLLALLLMIPLWQSLPEATTDTAAPVAEMNPADSPPTAGETPSYSQPAESKETTSADQIAKSPQAAASSTSAPAPSPANNTTKDPGATGYTSGDPDATQITTAFGALAPLHRKDHHVFSTRKEKLNINSLIGSASVMPPANARLLAALDAQSPAGVLAATARQSFNLQPTPKNRYLYFGMFGSMDYNRIMTPSERFFDVETHAFDRYALGYSGGFSLGLEWGRWELQSGAIYTAKRYRPLQLQIRVGNSRDGYSTEQLEDITLNILHIPLNLRYNFFQFDRWRLYTLAGASLQIATQANYFVDSNGTGRSSVLSQYIENGWFEGGTFHENSYLSANIGLGIERFVTTRWSIFAQPTYQHALFHLDNGFGPTSDRINTMSILTGIRIRMQRN